MTLPLPARRPCRPQIAGFTARLCVQECAFGAGRYGMLRTLRGKYNNGPRPPSPKLSHYGAPSRFAIEAGGGLRGELRKLTLGRHGGKKRARRDSGVASWDVVQFASGPSDRVFGGHER